MAQIKQDYSLFPVKMASGKTIYYYQTYDNYGRRTSKKSTGKTNKTAADAWVKQLLKASPVLAGGNRTFSAFAVDWLEWDRCSYVRMKLATSPKDRPGISPSTVKKYKEIMTAHILPTFQDTPLGEITVSQIESWMFSLQDKGLTNKTIVNVQGVLNIMLKEAYRKDLIIFNPMNKAVRFTGERRKRDLLTMEEAQKVLSPSVIVGASSVCMDFCMDFSFAQYGRLDQKTEDDCVANTTLLNANYQLFLPYVLKK